MNDFQIGEVVKAKRGSRSQLQVAREMKTSGWKWSQTTVWQVETGQRPLRLAEAVDLARIFSVSVGEIVGEVTAESTESRLAEAKARLAFIEKATRGWTK